MATSLLKSASFGLLFTLLVIFSGLSEAQNPCSVADIPPAAFKKYEEVARSAVFNYLAAEEDGLENGGPMVQKKVATEENLSFFNRFKKYLDPVQLGEGAYSQILEHGEVPEELLENIGVDYVAEQMAARFIRDLKGPTKLALKVLRHHPELKYNPEEFKLKLGKIYAASDHDGANSEDIDDNIVDDPLRQCKADLQYLYDPVLQILGCLIKNVINGIIDGLLPCELNGECTTIPIFGEICIPQLCLNVTQPDRPIPGTTATYIDAQFKIPPGLTQGNLHWVGSYDQCNRISDVTYDTSLVGLPAGMHTFKSRYCMVKAWPANASLPINITLTLGVCLPDSCAATEVMENITDSLQVLGLRIVNMFCGHDDYSMSDDPSSIVALVILLIILILVVAATIYDMLIRKQLLVSKIRKIAPHLDNPTSVAASPVASPIGTPIPSTPTEDKFAVGNGPPLPVSFSVGSLSRQTSYTELHNDDFRKYSLSPANSEHDLPSALSRPPSYISQVSTMSTSDLLSNELGGLKLRVPSVTSVFDEPPSWLERFEGAFVAFSGYSNTLRFFTLDNTADRLLSCDGMKFMSLVWAMYGYNWLLGTLYSETLTTTNLLPVILERIPTFIFQIVINFPFSSDSAFVIAGCLLTYNWMKQYEKEKKITWRMVVRHYVHRYLRLMIPLMLVLMFYTCLYKLLVAGPLIPPAIADADRCRTHWHINMFFLTNFFNDGGMCLTWTFNVAILFQVHLITPLILVPLVLKPIVGYIIFGIMYVAHLITLGLFSANLADGGGFGVWFNDILLTPWCRCGPVFIGMATGYALFQHKGKPFNVPYAVRVVAWLLAIFCLMAPIFSTYDAWKDGVTQVSGQWNRAELINYQLWSRTAFGLGVAWLIFSAETEIGGFPGRFLRYKEWVPLSRLSYITLLLGPIFIFRNVYSQMEPITITSHLMTYFFLANMSWTLLIGWILMMIMQGPFAEFENALCAKTKRNIIKMGRNPLNEMMGKSQNTPKVPLLRRSMSSAPDITKPNDGLLRTPSGHKAFDLHRSVSHTSQL